MTLPRLAAIAERWERVPPLSVTTACIAQALGAKPAGRPSKGAANDDDGNIGELVAMMGGLQGFNTELPEWLRAQRAQTT